MPCAGSTSSAPAAVSHCVQSLWSARCSSVTFARSFGSARPPQALISVGEQTGVSCRLASSSYHLPLHSPPRPKAMKMSMSAALTSSNRFGVTTLMRAWRCAFWNAPISAHSQKLAKPGAQLITSRPLSAASADLARASDKVCSALRTSRA